MLPHSRHAANDSERAASPNADWEAADVRKAAEADTADLLEFGLAKLRVRCLRSNEPDPVKLGHWETAMGIKSYTAAPTAALALALFFTPPVSIAIDAIITTVASLVPAAIGNLSFMSPAMGQPGALTKKQSDALNAYNNAVNNFESILGQRRAQINSNQRLPNLPGQALYLARNNMMSAYKDLTDALPSKIGRPNKFGIPPAYFDADNEPLIDEYRETFRPHGCAARQRAKIRYAIQGRCRSGNRDCASQGP